MKIDLSLYPKHNWHISIFEGFFDLDCKDCGYYIRERYIEEKNQGIHKYIRYGFHDFRSNNIISGHITNEMRKLPLSCEEIIIKKLLE